MVLPNWIVTIHFLILIIILLFSEQLYGSTFFLVCKPLQRYFFTFLSKKHRNTQNREPDLLFFSATDIGKLGSSWAEVVPVKFPILHNFTKVDYDLVALRQAVLEFHPAKFWPKSRTWSPLWVIITRGINSSWAIIGRLRRSNRYLPGACFPPPLKSWLGSARWLTGSSTSNQKNR